MTHRERLGNPVMTYNLMRRPIHFTHLIPVTMGESSGLAGGVCHGGRARYPLARLSGCLWPE